MEPVGWALPVGLSGVPEGMRDRERPSKWRGREEPLA